MLQRLDLVLNTERDWEVAAEDIKVYRDLLERKYKGVSLGILHRLVAHIVVGSCSWLFFENLPLSSHFTLAGGAGRRKSPSPDSSFIQHQKSTARFNANILPRSAARITRHYLWTCPRLFNRFRNTHTGQEFAFFSILHPHRRRASSYHPDCRFEREQQCPVSIPSADLPADP